MPAHEPLKLGKGDKEELLHFFRSCEKHGQDEQDAIQVLAAWKEMQLLG